MYSKLASVILGLFTVIMTVIGADVERNAIKAVHATTAIMHASPEKEAADEGVIRSRFLMFLVGGGSFGGAVVCVLLWLSIPKTSKDGHEVKKNHHSITSHFSVSLLTAIFLTPLILKKWFNYEPEECFAGSFMLAVSAWVLWGIAYAIGNRMLKAAEKSGLSGVKDEVLGVGGKAEDQPKSEP